MTSFLLISFVHWKLSIEIAVAIVQPCKSTRNGTHEIENREENMKKKINRNSERGDFNHRWWQWPRYWWLANLELKLCPTSTKVTKSLSSTFLTIYVAKEILIFPFSLSLFHDFYQFCKQPNLNFGFIYHPFIHVCVSVFFFTSNSYSNSSSHSKIDTIACTHIKSKIKHVYGYISFSGCFPTYFQFDFLFYRRIPSPTTHCICRYDFQCRFIHRLIRTAMHKLTLQSRERKISMFIFDYFDDSLFAIYSTNFFSRYQQYSVHLLATVHGSLISSFLFFFFFCEHKFCVNK